MTAARSRSYRAESGPPELRRDREPDRSAGWQGRAARTFYLADLDLYALAAHAELLRADAHRDQALEEGGASAHLHVTE
jgi:hypothetical protein